MKRLNVLIADEQIQALDDAASFLGYKGKMKRSATVRTMIDQWTTAAVKLYGDTPARTIIEMIPVAEHVQAAKIKRLPWYSRTIARLKKII